MKNLNVILGQDDKDKVTCLHVGESLAEAKEVVEAEMEKGSLLGVKWIRNPSGKVFRPARVAKKKSAKKKAAKKATKE